MKKKIFATILLLLAILISISAVNAVDNITLNSGDSIEGEVTLPTERLDIQFDDEHHKYSFKVTDERIYTDEDMHYNCYVDNKLYCGGSAFYSNNQSTNYHPYQYIKYNDYKDGEHNLIINKGFSKTPLFNVTFNIKNNVALSDNIIIQHTKTVKYKISDGIITSSSYPGKLNEGWNNLTEFGLTSSGSTNPVILKVYYRPYIINNVDVRNLTSIDPYPTEELFFLTAYNPNTYSMLSTAYDYNPEKINLEYQRSTNGKYNYQYKKLIIVPTEVSKPIYTYKKVKSGYQWKYYKTKWHNTKIVTHTWKKGKLIVDHNKLRKVRNLLNKNGKITKTVYSSTKRTVYIKYPVDYYKKVPKYKTKKILQGYKTVIEKKEQEIWVDAVGTLEDICNWRYL